MANDVNPSLACILLLGVPMIVEIEAKFACDDYGTEFLVQLDPDYDPPDDWTVMDVAEDSVRAGLTYRAFRKAAARLETMDGIIAKDARRKWMRRSDRPTTKFTRRV